MDLASRWLSPASLPRFGGLTSSSNNLRLVLTPSTVPSFTIPGESRISRTTSVTGLSPTSPDSGFNSVNEIHHPTHTIETENETDGRTNADPFSVSALSLPHIHKVTNFGFDTLSERPTTRRKESLFHETSLEKLTLSRGRGSLRNSRSEDDQHFRPLIQKRMLSSASRSKSENAEDAFRTTRRPVASLVAPLGVVSPRQRAGMADASLVLRGVDSTGRHGLGTYGTNKASRLRRFSICNSVSTSVDTSSDRKLSLCTYAHSKSDLTLSGNEGVPAQPEVALRLDYLESEKQLRVRLLQATNLPNQVQPHVGVFAKLSLLSNKSEKRSRVSKGTDCPVFIEDFFFRVADREHLVATSLHVRFFQKTAVFRRNEKLGIAILYLSELATTDKWEGFLPIQEIDPTKNLGQVEVSLRFCPAQECLDIQIMAARNLHRKGTQKSKATESHILMELIQPNRACVKRLISVSRNSSDEDSMILSISPKIDDLEMTSITLTLYEQGKLRANSPVGQVRFGCGATEDAEFQHWNFVLQHPLKRCVRWHTFMEADPGYMPTT